MSVGEKMGSLWVQRLSGTQVGGSTHELGVSTPHKGEIATHLPKQTVKEAARPADPPAGRSIAAHPRERKPDAEDRKLVLRI